MYTFDGFAQELRETLTHLYDPIYQPPPGLTAILTRGRSSPAGSVQQMVIAAIQQLQPGADVPPTARSRRLYELLSCRYVQELTQEETAERLGITARHLRREQQQAVHMLAQWLWTNWGTAEDAGSHPDLASPDPPAETTWRSQVHQELAVLEASDPGAIADVGSLMDQVVQLEKGLAAHIDASLVVEPVTPGIEVAIHPSVLRQILLVAIQKLAQASSQPQVTVRMAVDDASVEIFLTGTSIPPNVTVTSEFIAETVSLHGGQCDVMRIGDMAQFRIRLPRIRPVRLLVVDDNADIVHVYRRYLERTRYRVTHVATGQAVFERIEAQPPDIVLLDVMLPDMDGWEILTRLHDDPETRSIPVVVCSVVRQEELALALGAACYVPKPVRRSELIQALDQALALGSRAGLIRPENKAEAY